MNAVPRLNILLAAVAAATLAGAATIAATPASAAAVKGKVICTEREPADAPTHYRFENGASQPEVIIDIDYAAPQAVPRWEAGRTYLMTIDNNTEQVPQAGPAMFAGRPECTVESKDAFKLAGTEGDATMSVYVSWETDPVPATAPWSKSARYTVRINDLPGKTPAQPTTGESTDVTPAN